MLTHQVVLEGISTCPKTIPYFLDAGKAEEGRRPCFHILEG